MLLSHRIWAQLLFGQAQQKAIKIYEGGGVQEVLITLYDAEPQGKDGLPASNASSAEPTGWAISVCYKASPETMIFQQTFVSQEEATKVFSDIASAAAEAEGLIKQEKFEEASKATDNFLAKMKANSSQTPIETKD